jgi:hypothetical protein
MVDGVMAVFTAADFGVGLRAEAFMAAADFTGALAEVASTGAADSMEAVAGATEAADIANPSRA